MSGLIYPTLDLFLYDLRYSFNATEEEKDKNRANFLAKLSKLPDDIQFSEPDIETEYLELFPKQKRYKFTASAQDKNLEGYYYPVCLNDTYGLQIDCSIDNQTESQSTDCIDLLKAEIEGRLQGQTATIGQTWMLSGWLPELPTKTPEKIAEDCYQALVKDGNWERDLKGEGIFLGSKIFELWQYQPLREDNLHVIIIIYPNREIAEKAANFYPDWMGLFCYRHKILWSYTQSRLLKKDLINYSQKLEEKKRNISRKNIEFVDIQSIESRLAEIQNILEDYTVALPKLYFQQQIVGINLLNYQRRLEIIQQRAGKGEELGFLNEFAKRAEDKYLIQITKDCENMELGLRLLETNINAIRSQIEVEKAQRDKNFQNLVTLIGAGTAVTALIDFEEGKRCETIVAEVEKYVSFQPDWCDKFWLKTVILPMGMIILFGIIALILKTLFFENLSLKRLLFYRRHPPK
ncbi:MAG: hypothetical protein AB4426_09755 [Xenococcaceae cyanobacterium]